MRFGRGDVDFVDKVKLKGVFYHVDSHEFKKELISPCPDIL
jgi:hypothetical protein